MAEYDDPYARSGPFVDIMIARWWDRHGATVAEAVRRMPADQGPLLDAGAGGGRGTRLLARTLPRARVLAVEPSPLLRAVLLSHAASCEDMRTRVTVDGDDLLSARLPERLGGVLAVNLLGHLSSSERDRLWRDLAERLAPGAFALVNLNPPLEPEYLERARRSEVRVGGRTYAGWSEAEPAGPGRITWHMAYEVHEGERLVSRDEVDYDWWTLSEHGLRAETAPHGFEVRAHGPAEAFLFEVGRRPSA